MLECLSAKCAAVRLEADVQDILCWDFPAFLIVLADACAERIAVVDDDRQLIGIDAMFWQQQVNVV